MLKYCGLMLKLLTGKTPWPVKDTCKNIGLMLPTFIEFFMLLYVSIEKQTFCKPTSALSMTGLLFLYVACEVFKIK